MNPETEKIEIPCPRAEIAAYIDGELSGPEELELEKHLAVCASCTSYLNEQKKLLCALDFAFVGEREIPLPKDFTKRVVIKAESHVRGLRCPRERARALMICAVLFLLILVGIGSETEEVFSTFGGFFEQVWVIGGFVGHLIFDITVGTTIVLRSISHQFVFSPAFAFFAVIAFLLVFMLTVSRLFLRLNRSKI